jgi:hypothetical protein
LPRLSVLANLISGCAKLVKDTKPMHNRINGRGANVRGVLRGKTGTALAALFLRFGGIVASETLSWEH